SKTASTEPIGLLADVVVVYSILTLSLLLYVAFSSMATVSIKMAYPLNKSLIVQCTNVLRS
ncbi:hypothetical protein BLOT_007243, partial [Blomia tropicalis]